MPRQKWAWPFVILGYAVIAAVVVWLIVVGVLGTSIGTAEARTCASYANQNADTRAWLDSKAPATKQWLLCNLNPQYYGPFTDEPLDEYITTEDDVGTWDTGNKRPPPGCVYRHSHVSDRARSNWPFYQTLARATIAIRYCFAHGEVFSHRVNFIQESPGIYWNLQSVKAKRTF